MIYTHHVKQFHSDTCARSGRVAITLPGLPGLNITADRSETDPTLPTIRARKAPHLHGAALASRTATQVDTLARLICTARASTQPAVTVAMEGL